MFRLLIFCALHSLTVAFMPTSFLRRQTIAATLFARKKEDAQVTKTRTKERNEIIEEILHIMQSMGNEKDSMEKERADLDMYNAVVRVYCTHSPPSFAMPWQRLRQEFSTSTGFVIETQGEKKLLTNAHAIEYGNLIQVKKRDSENKFVASVEAVGHECDLAILRVEDASFWESMSPLKLGAIPELLEEVSVIGYPVGGDSISISSGVVSRIEMQEYAQASAQLLAIQIDAAINGGNSGGPVVNSFNEVIGVAFQSLSAEDIENIGYVVPSNVINHFLNDVEKHGRYSGVPGLGIRMQGMENPELRRHHGMADSDTGILILSCAPLSPAAAILRKNDVLLKVDGIRIANDCTIPFRDGNFKERVQVNYYFTQRFENDIVELEILRGKKRTTVKVPLWVPKRLIPRSLTKNNVIDTQSNQGTGTKGSVVGGVPHYMMVGGLVFLALSKEYLDTEFNLEHMAQNDFEVWAEEFRLLALTDSNQQLEGEEVVILSQVISHACNIGYETYRNMHLKTFNDVVVKSLSHLQDLVRAQEASRSTKKKKPLVFEFQNGMTIVLDASSAFSSQAEIESHHFISKERGANM